MTTKTLHIAEQYATDVLNGKIPACKWIKLACERYFNDLEQCVEKGWYFDRKAAQRNINFFHKYLEHFQGQWAGKPFILDHWQQFVSWNVFGFKNSDGTRRFNEVGIFVPRKNGKTEYVSGQGLFGMAADGEMAAEVYSTATDKDQAKIAFEKAKKMVQNSDKLLELFEPLANAIVAMKYAATFKAWSSDTGKKDGYNPHFAIVDEYHAHRDDSMVDVIESGLGARTQPIVWKITTAGFNEESPAKNYQEVCQKVLEGTIQQNSLFTLIFTIDQGDNWEDPKVWEKANPSYNSISTIPKFLADSFRKAKNDPSKVVNFKTKNLNVWEKAAKTWLEKKYWAACKQDYTAEDLHDMKCYGGLDLSDGEDMTAFSLYFPEIARQLWWFWLPEARLKDHRNSDMYLKWANDGYLIITPGNVIDYNSIRKTVSGYYIEDGVVKHDSNCIADLFDLQSTGFDPYNAKQVVLNMKETDGLQFNAFRQGFLSMSYPMKEYKKEILGAQIFHNDNPIANWQISNMTEKKDPAGNIKPDKSKPNLKIDGIVASIMARGEAFTFETENEETFEIRSIKI